MHMFFLARLPKFRKWLLSKSIKLLLIKLFISWLSFILFLVDLIDLLIFHFGLLAVILGWAILIFQESMVIDIEFINQVINFFLSRLIFVFKLK